MVVCLKAQPLRAPNSFPISLEGVESPRTQFQPSCSLSSLSETSSTSAEVTAEVEQPRLAAAESGGGGGLSRTRLQCKPIHTLCLHMAFVQRWGGPVQSGPGFSEAQSCPMAGPGSLCGSSDLRCIIKSAHSSSQWPRWLWGPGPRLSGAERGSLRSRAQGSSCTPVQPAPHHSPATSRHDRKHFIQYISAPSVKDVCYLIYSAAVLPSLNQNKLKIMMEL